MQEERKEYGIRKINNKHWYKVFVSGANGKTFYKLMVSQKNYDESETKYYVNVSFKKSLQKPQDGAVIRLIGFIENMYGDDIYNPKYSYTITDYEVKENQELKEASAIEEFGQILAENESEREFEDEDLPF